jgi:hypothetical protein
MHIDPKIFEALMLLCFGSSWPFAVSKTIKTRSVQGKSILFLFLIFIGYVSGVVYKVTSNFDHVIWIYCLNGTMVFIEILLFFRYQHQNNPTSNSIKVYGNFFRLNRRFSDQIITLFKY